MQTYGDASRGPTGAFLFIVRRRKASVATYAACAITTLALVVDPFSQQILSFTTLPTLSPNSLATTARSTYYDFGNEGIGSAYNQVSARDNKMAAAAMGGLYGLQVPISLQCTSTNCTFPDFTSLAVCSQCDDVTASTIQTCNSNDTNLLGYECNYQLPSGSTLSGTGSRDAHNGFRHTKVNTTTMQDLRNEDHVPTTFTKHGAPIVYMGLINFPYAGDDLDSWNTNYQVHQCDFHFCAKKFRGIQVVNGTMSVQEILQRDIGNSSTPEHGFNITLTALQPWEGDSTFVISYYEIGSYEYFLRAMLDLTASSFGPTNSVDQSVVGALSNASRPILFITEDISTSLTNRMLQGPQAEIVRGDVWVSKVYIRVSWIWLTIPILLVFTSSILLGTVVSLTYRYKQHIWKSSLLPMLFMNSDVSDTHHEPYGKTWTISQMDTKAEGTKSRLLIRDGHTPSWSFS